eukprot:1161625-Pelagomonas_calceolata.AAC.19
MPEDACAWQTRHGFGYKAVIDSVFLYKKRILKSEDMPEDACAWQTRHGFAYKAHVLFLTNESHLVFPKQHQSMYVAWQPLMSINGPLVV